MNRSQLITTVIDKLKLPKKRAEQAVHLIFDAMIDALKHGERIEIRGLGSFVVRQYGAYRGRNPRTGDAIQVAPKRLPFFKVGKELKERVDTLHQTPSP